MIVCFACICVARRMTVWLSAAAPAYLPCALVSGGRSGSDAGQGLLSCLSRFPMADLARRVRTIFGTRQNVVHGMRRIIGAMRGGAGAALLTDRFYHVAPHMSIGNFPRRRKHAMTVRQAAAACDGTKSTRHDHVNNRRSMEKYGSMRAAI